MECYKIVGMAGAHFCKKKNCISTKGHGYICIKGWGVGGKEVRPWGFFMHLLLSLPLSLFYYF